MKRADLRTKLAEADVRKGELESALREPERRQEARRSPKISYAHLTRVLMQMNQMDLVMARPPGPPQALRRPTAAGTDRPRARVWS